MLSDGCDTTVTDHSEAFYELCDAAVEGMFGFEVCLTIFENI